MWMRAKSNKIYATFLHPDEKNFSGSRWEKLFWTQMRKTFLDPDEKNFSVPRWEKNFWTQMRKTFLHTTEKNFSAPRWEKNTWRAFKTNISPDQQKKATLIKDDTWSKECVFLATKRKYIAIYDNVNKFCSWGCFWNWSERNCLNSSRSPSTSFLIRTWLMWWVAIECNRGCLSFLTIPSTTDLNWPIRVTVSFSGGSNHLSRSQGWVWQGERVIRANASGLSPQSNLLKEDGCDIATAMMITRENSWSP